MENFIKNIYKNKLLINKYIGSENKSSIYEGIFNNNKKDLNVIVKVISRKDIDNFNKILLEIGFLKYLTKYVSSKKYIYLCHNVKITPEYIIIIQEAPKGITLRKFIEKIMSLSFTEYYKLILVIIYKLLLAINYIHTKSVAHRALNPDNIYIVYDESNKNIIDLKITDFSISCGKYDELSVSVSENNNNNHNHNKTKTKTNTNKTNNVFCDTLDLLINPPENFNIDTLVKKIQKISNDQTRESTYLYLAKKADIWALGIIFWKLLNRNNLEQNPLELKFPVNYQKDNSWKKFKGYNDDKLIPRIFKVVIDLMLNEIPYRGKSNEILENFVILNKYYDDYDDNLKKT
jgi:serine/threonine protein kinase